MHCHPLLPQRLSWEKTIPFFFAKCAEIDLSLAMPTSQNALPQNSQEKPGLQNGQV